MKKKLDKKEPRKKKLSRAKHHDELLAAQEEQDHMFSSAFFRTFAPFIFQSFEKKEDQRLFSPFFFFLGFTVFFLQYRLFFQNLKISTDNKHFQQILPIRYLKFTFFTSFANVSVFLAYLAFVIFLKKIAIFSKIKHLETISISQSKFLIKNCIIFLPVDNRCPSSDSRKRRKRSQAWVPRCRWAPPAHLIFCNASA